MITIWLLFRLRVLSVERSLLPRPFFRCFQKAGLEGLKISHASFLLQKSPRKDTKTANENRQFHSVVGRRHTDFYDQQCQFLKNAQVWATKTNQTGQWLPNACVPFLFCLGASAANLVDVHIGFSRFKLWAFSSSGLAFSVFIFGPICDSLFLSPFLQGPK